MSSKKTNQGKLFKLLYPTFESETYDTETTNRATKQLNDILDEAKKDFPKIYESVNYRGERCLALEPFETEKWFKKWFGET